MPGILGTTVATRKHPRMSRSLTVGRPWRVILLFAIPLLLGNVVQQLYQVTDTIVVGRVLGVDALAAVGATGSLLFLLLGFAWGLTSGFAIPTAQAFGAGDAAAVRRSVAAGVVLTGATSLLITVLAVPLARPALELMRTPAELLPQATTFAVISFAGAATMMFFNFLSAILRAIGDSRTPLVFLTVSCVVNIALVLALVAGLGRGVGAAALATVLSQAVSVALCLHHIRRAVPDLRVRAEDWRVTPAELRHHLRIGVPMGFQASIIAIGTLAVQVRLNSLGADAVAAYTAAARIDGLAVALLGSLGLATSMYVAQNHGAGRGDRIRSGVRQALGLSVIGALGLGAVMVIGGRPLAEVFVGADERVVVDLAALLLLVNGATYAFLAVLFVLRGALQGLGHTLIPTLTGIVELVMRVGAAIVLGAAFGFAGVVWGNPLAWVGAVLILVPAAVVAMRRPTGRAPAVPDDAPAPLDAPAVVPATAAGLDASVAPVVVGASPGGERPAAGQPAAGSERVGGARPRQPSS